ncbi:hypothetical protein [Methanospirillum sp.]|uniref:hypothetical protein n=1 Tax=Methanospirillum sp. TaxID=45200 RepID=UPI002D1F9D74|nr:hypothetical protein [Methanospirillum sp.]
MSGTEWRWSGRPGGADGMKWREHSAPSPGTIQLPGQRRGAYSTCLLTLTLIA